MKFTIEYLWLGDDKISNINNININRKIFYTKVKTFDCILDKLELKDIPEWSFDGSSTGHIKLTSTDIKQNTEIILKPVKLYSHFNNKFDYIVLCQTYLIDNTPHKSNTRTHILSLFNDFVENKPCYGLEQEYIFMDSLTNTIYGSTINDNTIHYCSSSIHHAKLRPIVENHYIKCLQMGINISGFNSEVTQSQWEFQIGPTIGIDASDDLTMARFVLERLCESDNLYINYHSKPIKDYNGSGCHHNFSTIHTNKYTKSTFESAYSEIFNNFSNNHKITLKYYGVDNELRLTGINETSNMLEFSYGIGTRHTSIRIPINNYVYFEDRRPSASCDPYLSTWALFATYMNII